MNDGPAMISNDERHRLEALAQLVGDELAAAGLNVDVEGGVPFGAGALVTVDKLQKDVRVGWRTHHMLSDAWQEAWGDDPHREGPEIAAFRELGQAIDSAMYPAILAIVTAAGLEAHHEQDDYGQSIVITGKKSDSPWRARRDATFLRRYEGMQAAWNKRHQEERRAAAQEGPEGSTPSE